MIAHYLVYSSFLSTLLFIYLYHLQCYIDLLYSFVMLQGTALYFCCQYVTLPSLLKDTQYPTALYFCCQYVTLPSLLKDTQYPAM